MRADAKRNRERIVEAARAVFREQGYGASLDAVAKRAGVGPGTLYRHFATREDLVDAILQSWVSSVDDAVEKALAHEGAPRELLLDWFETYVGLVSAYKGSPAKITSAIGDPDSPIMTKCQTLIAANERVLNRLEEQKALREGMDSIHVARLVGGVATVADNADLPAESVRPLLEVVVDGLVVSA